MYQLSYIVQRFLSKKLKNLYIEFNQKSFGENNSKFDDSKKILLEFNAGCSNHIAYSYFVNSLSKKYNAKINGYIPNTISLFFKKIEWIFSSNLILREFSIYKSFGVSNFIRPIISKELEDISQKKFIVIYSAIRNKFDIEDIHINGILIGDLIYDSFLKKYRLPTINYFSKEFKEFLFYAICQFLYWEAYFNKVNVSALVCSHCVYLTAIPLRIAIERGIPAYQVNATHAYRLTKKRLFAYNEFFDYPEKFRALSSSDQKEGLVRAENRIQLRFSGQVGVDMTYSTQSAFKKVYGKRLIKESPRKKILIAAHCFFDSPHSYGKNLFPDFYEWLKFLGEVSNNTEYDWYIKTHPDYISETLTIIKKFIDRYPKFQLLPSDCSHHQIVSEGIDIALTTYGTIGFEYAALNVPVINCSINNPHIAYDFNIHPKSVIEYRNLLFDLKNLKLEIEKLKVYEYYYMHNIYNTDNWLFNNYSKMENDLGSYKKQFSPDVYGYWLEHITPQEHQKIIQRVECFIDSDDFRLDQKHFSNTHD